MQTNLTSTLAALQWALHDGSARLSLLLIAIVLVSGVALSPIFSPPPSASAPAANYDEAALARQRYEILKAQWLERQRANDDAAAAALDYTAAQELTLAQQRYEALQTARLQQPAGYEPATEAELAPLRFDALQAQWRERQAGIAYSAELELTLAQRRYAALQAQRSDLYGGAR